MEDHSVLGRLQSDWGRRGQIVGALLILLTAQLPIRNSSGAHFIHPAVHALLAVSVGWVVALLIASRYRRLYPLVWTLYALGWLGLIALCFYDFSRGTRRPLPIPLSMTFFWAGLPIGLKMIGVPWSSRGGWSKHTQPSEDDSDARVDSKIKRILTYLALSPFLLVAGCDFFFAPQFYYSENIRGTLIDEQTGKPLTGAVVVAKWYVVLNLVESNQRLLYANEAVTNYAGEFELEGLPPRFRWPFFYFEDDDPQLWAYKPGYSYHMLDNMPFYREGYRERDFNSGSYKRRSFWNGKQIALRPLLDGEDHYRSLERMESEISSVESPQGLHPRRFPNTWKTLMFAYDQLPPAVKARHPHGPRDAWRYWRGEKR